MPDDVRRCDNHGFVTGERCPVCGRSGQVVLAGDRRRLLSKYLSGALRHFPGDAGLTLGDAGWTPFEDLVAAAERQYDWATRERVAAVVATDPKGRFERTGAGAAGRDRVRAAYGHSVDVDLDAGETPVPDTLYHGTAPRHLDAILDEGLRPMDRQQVHLAETAVDAREVGQRHADDPVVLAVDATGMRDAGHTVTKRGPTVYTTDRVPPNYVSVLSDEE